MSDSTSSSTRNGWDVLIVFIALGAVSGLAIFAMNKYTEPKDVATVLAVVFGPIATLVAAAFGVSQASQASAAKNDARNKKDKAKELKTAGSEAIGRANNIISSIQRAGESHAGSGAFVVAAGSPLTIEANELVQLRSDLAALDDGLDSLSQ